MIKKLALTLALLPLAAQAQQARVETPAAECIAQISAASYDGPTTRYAHGVLGDEVEYGTLRVTLKGQAPCKWMQREATVTLPETMVFEDLAPRLWDLSGDGKPELVVIESHRDRGARLAVWGIGTRGLELLAATPFIGRSNRWLAPIGAADLDGDGKVEVAYIDRPHLAKLLRVWRYEDGELKLVAERDGLTNHRIGQDFISGGLRDCGKGPVLITANADWSRLVATTLMDGKLHSQDYGPHQGQRSFKDALKCR